MNIAIAALGTLMLATAPVLSAGFERVVVPDPNGSPLEAGIWYPSEAPAASQALGLYRQTVATNGLVVGRGLPLVVMSHGTGGSFEGHYDTALALAEAGFVVAAVTHTGDNYRDQSQFRRLDNRPRHIKALIDYMLASWPHRDLLDPARIGMFGFSAGGFTALVAVGGTPDMTTVAPYCAAHPDEWSCRRLKEQTINVSAPSTAPNWDRGARGRLRLLARGAFRHQSADPALARRQRRNPATSQLRPSRLRSAAGEARISRGAECRPLRIPGAVYAGTGEHRAGDLLRSCGLRSHHLPSRIQSRRGGLLLGEAAAAMREMCRMG
jgi:predicted dienelactone hydrolase